VGVGAGTVLWSACGGGLTDSNGGGPPNSVSLTLDVNAHPELASVGGYALVSDTNGNALAVVRTGTTSFVALSRVCPHAGGTINPQSGGFRCTLHGAQFDQSGYWVGGQPTSSMRSYPAAYNAATGQLVIG
jgi:Rieske Fe-S protein